MKNENEDNYSEHGIKTFGFGFPTLIYRAKLDTEKVIKAPIFIWNLDIERSIRKADMWEIIRGDDYPVYLNPILINFLKHDTGLDELPEITEEYLEDGLINEEELIELCSSLSKAVNNECASITTPIILENIKDKNTLEEIANVPGLPIIIYSGIFGLFRTPKESIIKDLTKLIDSINDFKFEDLIIEKYQSIPYCSVDTDPNQNEVVKNVSLGKKIIVHGPPGTGKSQSLTAIITNALANNLKCLVVCEKRTALEVIEKNLKKVGLLELCTIIEDVIRDRRKAVESVRDRRYIPIRRKYLYHETIKEADSIIKMINTSHGFFDKDVLCQWKWTDLVGKYIRLSKISSSIEILRKALESKEFQFDYPENTVEYNTQLDNISLNHNLFNKIKAKYDVLNKLGDFFLSYQSIVVANMDLNEKLNYFKSKAKKIIILGDSLTNEYHNNLSEYYKQIDSDVNKLCAAYGSIFNDIREKYHPIFLRNNKYINRIIKIMAFFSKKYKYLQRQRKALDDTISKLMDIDKLNLFGQKLESLTGCLDYDKEMINFDAFCKAENECIQTLILCWRKKLTVFIVKTINRICFLMKKSKNLNHYIPIFPMNLRSKIC